MTSGRKLCFLLMFSIYTEISTVQKYTTVFDVRTINGYNAGPAERLLKSVARQICNVKTKFI